MKAKAEIILAQLQVERRKYVGFLVISDNIFRMKINTAMLHQSPDSKTYPALISALSKPQCLSMPRLGREGISRGISQQGIVWQGGRVRVGGGGGSIS
jgi:hypothetical protein